MQKLILPFKKNMFICGYKNKMYKKQWGYSHFGVDITATQGIEFHEFDRTIYGSGRGYVVDCGYDNSGGNIVIVRYKDVFNHKTGEISDLVARYMHLAKIYVSPSDTVTPDTRLGEEGTTPNTTIHLHIEFDTDLKFPYHSPQVSSKDDHKTRPQGNVLKHGIDTTVNPSYIFHAVEDRAIIAPVFNPSYLNKEDFDIPFVELGSGELIPPAELEQAEIKRLLAEMKSQLDRTLHTYNQLEAYINGSEYNG